MHCMMKAEFVAVIYRVCGVCGRVCGALYDESRVCGRWYKALEGLFVAVIWRVCGVCGRWYEALGVCLWQWYGEFVEFVTDDMKHYRVCLWQMIYRVCGVCDRWYNENAYLGHQARARQRPANNVRLHSVVPVAGGLSGFPFSLICVHMGMYMWIRK